MFYIDDDKCSGCGECVLVCPQRAITLENNKARINQTCCNECGTCHEVCREGAVFEAVGVGKTAGTHKQSSLEERKEVSEMLYGRGWLGQGGAGMGRGRGYGTDTGYGRGMGFGGGRGFGRGMGMGRGNPYPFCRFDPSLPRRWWASGGGLYPPAPWRSYGWHPAWGPGRTKCR